MRKFGLIGKKLSHSFSPGFFNDKFSHLGIKDTEYLAYELDSIEEIKNLFKLGIDGLNVTIPYKQEVMPFLDDIDQHAQRIGAVNCIKNQGGKYIGYNTDWLGFSDSLTPLIKDRQNIKALVLGYGGASRAIVYSLELMEIQFEVISRKSGMIGYDACTKEYVKKYELIINTTSLGMYPNLDDAPQIDYGGISDKHILYDLIYNPEMTLFLKKGKERGALIKNGYEMLVGQAEQSWRIWNEL